LTQDLPRLRDPLFRCVRRGILENVFGVSAEEVVETGIDLGEEVVLTSG